MKRPAGSPDIAADALKSPNFFSPEKKTLEKSEEKSEEKSWNSFGDKKGMRRDEKGWKGWKGWKDCGYGLLRFVQMELQANILNGK